MADDQDRGGSAVMDEDRRKQDGTIAHRYDDDIAEQGRVGSKDDPRDEDDEDRHSER